MDTWHAERLEFNDEELEEERVEGGIGSVGLGLICVIFLFVLLKWRTSRRHPPMRFPGPSYVVIPFLIWSVLFMWFHLLKQNIHFCSSNGHEQRENVLFSVT